MPSVLQDLVFWRLKTFFFSLISAMRLKIYFEIQKLNVAVFVLSTFLLYPLHAEDGENRASYYCLIGWRGGGVTENTREIKTQTKPLNKMAPSRHSDAGNCLLDERSEC